MIPSLVPNPFRRRDVSKLPLIAALLSIIGAAMVLAALWWWCSTPEREARAHDAMVDRTTEIANERMRDAERGAALGMTPPEGEARR